MFLIDPISHATALTFGCSHIISSLSHKIIYKLERSKRPSQLDRDSYCHEAKSKSTSLLIDRPHWHCQLINGKRKGVHRVVSSASPIGQG